MSLPKKTKSHNVKRLTVLGVVLMAIVFIGYFFLEKMLQSKFESILNANPDRAYDIRYENLSLSILSTEVKMTGVTILPISTDSTATSINGKVSGALLSGVGILDFLFNRAVKINELTFENPDFTMVHVNREQTKKGSNSLQNLFKDIISRGEIKNFSLINGSAELFLKTDSVRKIGSFEEFNIVAKGLSTDAIRLNYAIPFEFDNIHTSFSNLVFDLEEGKILTMDHFQFDYEAEQLDIAGLKLAFDQPWQEIAKRSQFQGDVIDFSLSRLSIQRVAPSSSFYDSLVFVAEKMEIDSLLLRDGRDKNIPRPPDVVKENVAALLKSLSVPIQVDTIRVKNSEIQYSEINPGNSEAGTLTLSNLDVTILNATSLDSVERLHPFEIALRAKVNRVGDLVLKLTEDYENLKYNADITLGEMDMTALNPTLVNMAGIKIETGRIKSLRLQMKADTLRSSNVFSIEYEDLELDLLNAKTKEKKGFLSAVAKVGYHKKIEKGAKHYVEPAYVTPRNIYRGPINLIWLSLKDGLMQTIPTGAAQLFLPKTSKKELRKERKASKKGG